MSLKWLSSTNASSFPPVEQALPDGLLAAGGDLSSQRLIDAYKHGIFPWFNEQDPILWWSPDPRMVLFTDEINISKSFRKIIRKSKLNITIDCAFEQVITACSQPRIVNGSIETGTWIHPDMIAAYKELHQHGIAHSVECWASEQLVGGLYGIAIGQVFFGESMFSIESNSSKIALVALCKQLHAYGFPLIDCQIYSDHLKNMGANEIPRADFINTLATHCQIMPSETCWQLETQANLIL